MCDNENLQFLHSLLISHNLQHNNISRYFLLAIELELETYELSNFLYAKKMQKCNEKSECNVDTNNSIINQEINKSMEK